MRRRLLEWDAYSRVRGVDNELRGRRNDAAQRSGNDLEYRPTLVGGRDGDHCPETPVDACNNALAAYHDRRNIRRDDGQQVDGERSIWRRRAGNGDGLGALQRLSLECYCS